MWFSFNQARPLFIRWKSTPYIGRRFTEMEITIVQFMFGSLWRVLKSCFSNSALMVKILGLVNGTSLVLVISQLVIHLLYRHSKWIWFCNLFYVLFTKVAVPLYFLCRRELEEELGVKLPKDAFEKIFVFLQEWFVLKFNLLGLCDACSLCLSCYKSFGCCSKLKLTWFL